jgi:hypothetical protein
MDRNARNEDRYAKFDNTETPEYRERRGCGIEITSFESGSDVLFALTRSK